MKTIKPIGLLVLLFTIQSGCSQVVYKAEKSIVHGDSAWRLVVEKGFTWYGISKSFSVPIEVIKNYNSQDSVLKTGAILYIPFFEPRLNNLRNNQAFSQIRDSGAIYKQESVSRTALKTNSFKLALLLPFSMNDFEKSEARDFIVSKKKLPKTTEWMMSYYRGLIKGFELNNHNVHIDCYDISERDTQKVRTFVNQKNFESYDLIIGPVHPEPMKTLLKNNTYSKKPVVYPFIQNSVTVDTTPQFLHVMPGVKELVENLADYCVDSISRHSADIQIKIANPKDVYEQDLVKMFIQRANKRIKFYNPLTSDTLVSGTNRNSHCIVVLTSNEVFLNRLISQIALTKSSRTVLCSHIDLSKFQNLDMNDLKNLNFTFTSAYDIYFRFNYISDVCENEYYRFGESASNLCARLWDDKVSKIDFTNVLQFPVSNDGVLHQNYLHSVTPNGYARNRGVFIYQYNTFSPRKINWQSRP
jgi:hypothetical protein